MVKNQIGVQDRGYPPIVLAGSTAYVPPVEQNNLYPPLGYAMPPPPPHQQGYGGPQQLPPHQQGYGGPQQLPPQPQGYGAPQQPNIIIQQPRQCYGSHPQPLQCPYCHANIVSLTESRSGFLTWVLVGGLCFFGCWPCCLIPFCVDSCKDTYHTCPNCHRHLGVDKR